MLNDDLNVIIDSNFFANVSFRKKVKLFNETVSFNEKDENNENN